MPRIGVRPWKTWKWMEGMENSRIAVTPEVAGSSPVVPASYLIGLELVTHDPSRQCEGKEPRAGQP